MVFDNYLFIELDYKYFKCIIQWRKIFFYEPPVFILVPKDDLDSFLFSWYDFTGSNRELWSNELMEDTTCLSSGFLRELSFGGLR